MKKINGKNSVVKNIGTSSEGKKIEELIEQAGKELQSLAGRPEFNFEIGREKELLELFYRGIKQLRLVGPELLLGRIFDEIGFNRISHELFRHLVITRLVYPTSKLKTVDYLYKYKGITYQVDRVYRFLDKLHKNDLTQIQRIGYEYSKRASDNTSSVVFYDVTTLYFETEDEDDLRKTGFSKDGKHKNPQILLGLLVNAEGFPMDYELFEGNKYEGHTMSPVIEAFRKKYDINKLVIVADAGLMTNKNIKELVKEGDSFIIGARIKNETEGIKSKIIAMKLTDGQSRVIRKGKGIKLIISHSNQRQKKDECNRRRGLERLKKVIRGGKLTKDHLTKRGYNKYLKIEGDTKISIDEDKYNADAHWDGLKGYITNAKLSTKEVIEQYRQLWRIEKAFRISKTDLKIRPIYHQLRRRIESHICIAFAACIIYKELEKRLYKMKSELSVEKVLEILKTLYALTLKTPYSQTEYSRLLLLTEEQKALANDFQLHFG